MTRETVTKVLVALAAVFTAFGVLNLAGASQFLIDNLEILWGAVLTIAGFFTALIGFFRPDTVSTAEGTVKDVIGQILVALGAVAAFMGLSKVTEVVQFLLINLDAVYAAVLTVVGIVTGLLAYFRQK